MPVELAPDYFYELYEILLIQAYDSNKRPVHLSVHNAVQLALKVVQQDRHGELIEQRLYEIHSKVRRQFNIQPY